MKKQLERDLTTHGASVSVVLPQQIRIVFLGLRKLPSLTLTDYRRAASGAGVEALYIRDAIASAASESGLSEGDVRALLSAFVDRSEAGSIKTKVLSLADVAPVVGDAQKIQRALDRLERDEVVREKSALGDGGSRWQLDHDYIARAVVAEYRAANILSLQLQDGNEAWHMAGSNLRLRYRSLLTLSVQAKLAWARLRSPRIHVQTLSCLCRYQHASRLAFCPPARRRRLAVARDNIARRETANRDAPGAAVELLRFRGSLGCRFGVEQLLCARPGQVVVGGGCPRLSHPAALLQVIALFPAGRDLLQDCQVRFRIAVLQEFLHADRREGCHDGGISPLSRKLVGAASSHPAAPRKSDDNRRDGADSYSL